MDRACAIAVQTVKSRCVVARARPFTAAQFSSVQLRQVCVADGGCPLVSSRRCLQEMLAVAGRISFSSRRYANVFPCAHR